MEWFHLVKLLSGRSRRLDTGPYGAAKSRSAGRHWADFERERERADRLMAELLRVTADTLAAHEAAAPAGGELAGLRARPW
jgi:hypothetical protein